MIAICVTFDIKPGRLEAFMPLMHGQATLSLRETECHRFDVCTRGAQQDQVFLYELYADRAAFDVHLASDHFKAFDMAVADMIAAKSVEIYEDVSSS